MAIRSLCHCEGAMRPRQSVFPLKSITDSFALRVQNDRPFSHCGAGVRWTPLRSRSTDRAGRRDRRKVRGNPFSTPPVIAREQCDRGNPFSPKGYLRILSRYALRMTNHLVIAKPCKRLWQSVFPLKGIYGFFHAMRSE